MLGHEERWCHWNRDAPKPTLTDFLSSAYPIPLPASFKTACSMTAGKPTLVQILLQPCCFLSLFTSINFNGFPYINFVLNQSEKDSCSHAFWRTAWVIFPCCITVCLGSSGTTAILCTLLRAINFPRLEKEDLHIPEYTICSLLSLSIGLCWSSRWKFLPPAQHGTTEPAPRKCNASRQSGNLPKSGKLWAGFITESHFPWNH